MPDLRQGGSPGLVGDPSAGDVPAPTLDSRGASMTARARLTDDWLPLPVPVLAALGWGEGDQLELEVADGILVVQKVSSAPVAVTRLAPSRRSNWSLEKDRPSAT